MDPGIPVQNQNFTRNPEKLAKVPRIVGKAESHSYTYNSLDFGKSCEDLSWNHCTSTPHRPETNGITETAVRRINEGTSAVLLQSSLDERWWAASMECYCDMSKTSWQKGKHLMKDDLQNHSKAPFFRLVQWLKIILFLRRPSQGSTNL